MAGNEGLTVRWASADGAAGAEVVEDGDFAGVAVVLVAAFAGVAVVGAALDGVTHAARLDEDEMVRWDIRYAEGAALDEDAEMKAENPLLAGDMAIFCVQWVALMSRCNAAFAERRNAKSRFPDARTM